MAVALYMGVHVPRAITEQLRHRGIDVLTCAEDDTLRLSDEDLLERSSVLGRVLFTQDIRFKAMAEDWQRQHSPFQGLAFGHQLRGTLGQVHSRSRVDRQGHRS